jgi:hypothetical protein
MLARIDSLAKLEVLRCGLLWLGVDHAISHRTWTDCNPRIKGRKSDTKYADVVLQANPAKTWQLTPGRPRFRHPYPLWAPRSRQLWPDSAWCRSTPTMST